VDPCEPEEIHPWPDDEAVSWVAGRPVRGMDHGGDDEWIYETDPDPDEEVSS